MSDRETRPETWLPPGPGLARRWCAAVPLMLVSTVLPTFGQLALSAWASLAFNDVLPDLGERDPTFWTEFSDGLDDIGAVAALPAAVTVLFLLRRTRFAVWPATCLWLGVVAVGPMLLFGSVLDRDTLLPSLAFAAGLIWLNAALGRLTLRVLSRPVTRDLALSELEIPYRLPGSRARLRVQRDRLRVDRLHTMHGDVGKVVRLADVRAARLDRLAEPTSWHPTSETEVIVPAGPVLRVTGVDEEWLLPVDEATGEDLAAVITLRLHNRK